MSPPRAWRGAPMVRMGVLPVSIVVERVFDGAEQLAVARQAQRRAPVGQRPGPQRELVLVVVELLAEDAHAERRAPRLVRGAQANRAGALRHLRHLVAVELGRGETGVGEGPRRGGGEQPAQAPFEFERSEPIARALALSR